MCALVQKERSSVTVRKSRESDREKMRETVFPLLTFRRLLQLILRCTTIVYKHPNTVMFNSISFEIESAQLDEIS